MIPSYTSSGLQVKKSLSPLGMILYWYFLKPSTICDDIPNEEPERMESAKLYPDALETLNNWYDAGHYITFFTSRIEEHRKVTEKWLKKNGFKYHGLLMGKPRGGNYHWVDNHIVRATRFDGKFTDLVEKEVSIQVFKS